MNLAFFIHGDWAYGSIHHELTKQLFVENINSVVLPWEIRYTPEEFIEYDRTVDVYITAPQGTHYLCVQKKYTKPEKCITVFHSLLDLLHFVNNFDTALIQQCNRFAAVSEFLIDQARSMNINVDIAHLPLGINYQRFYSPVSESLRTIGYAGIFHERSEFAQAVPYDHPGLVKRSYLAKEIADELAMNFKLAVGYHNNFVTMSGYYPTIDALLCTSINEGAGLPVLEAAAAGKLVLTTRVGHYREKITPFGAIPLPMDESILKQTAKQILKFYKNNPTAYKEKCLSIQEHAKKYDWKNYITLWSGFITGAYNE